MEIFHWITVGALSMAFAYIVFQWINLNYNEYRLFALYILIILLSILGQHFFKAYTTTTEIVLYNVSRSALSVLSFIVSFRFMQQLLDFKSRFPAVNKVVNSTVICLVIYLVIDISLFTILKQYNLQFKLYNVVRLALVVISVTALIAILKEADTVAKYFIAGLFVYIFTGALTTVLHVLSNSFDVDVNNLPVFFYRSGVLIQIMFFSLGISKKTFLLMEEKKQLEINLVKEVYQKELEKQQAVQEERGRISSELHDDLGAGLSSIRFLSEVLKSKSRSDNDETSKISSLSSDLIDSMRQITWTMKNEQSTLEDLFFYIKNYSSEYLESNNISFACSIPEIVPHITLPGSLRRNIFLVVKESLHNIVKHAEAENVTLKAKVNGQVEIVISDNGKGMNESEFNRFGSGINNMKKRVLEINGAFGISSVNGTEVRVQFPLK